MDSCCANLKQISVSTTAEAPAVFSGDLTMLNLCVLSGINLFLFIVMNCIDMYLILAIPDDMMIAENNQNKLF